jgi:hypothetical protein
MNPTFGLLGPGHWTAQEQDVIIAAGGSPVNYWEPNGQRRRWVEVENLGEPFDSERLSEIANRLAALPQPKGK